MRLDVRTACSLGLLLFAHWAVADQPLELFASPAPPYQYAAGGTVQGSTVEALQCALKDSPWRPRIHMVPQRRAIHSLERGTIDGYLGMAASDELDRHAVISAPLALEKWYLYSKKPVSSLSDIRIGSVAGSNEATWLQRQGYQAAMQVSSLDQLVALVERGRIDGLVIDQRVMDAYFESDEKLQPAPDLTMQFVRFAPLGLYLGNNFVNAHPGFLHTFNTRLDSCVTSGFQLESHELSELHRQTNNLLKSLQQHVDLEDALNRSDNSYTLAEILMIDQLWQHSLTNKPTEEAITIAARPASHALKKWQAKHEGRISEMMLMDDQGALVAISQHTSDFWQGDEPKFREVVAQVGDELFIGPVRFDASSQRFQVTASKAIFDDRSGELIGAIAVGVDIEKALSGLQ
ncbi:transporter substrate-binding domain-containing protein [Marinobacter fonticola]|uniref:transporter substrate-binding domain-containing protein n=1 Tax=Marinobacter fonticola TaxID=2603215 RepID=UPI0011E737AF|nr:transporter substrate-binding domain-containing protein [Marinobacter fonticola]